MSGIKETLTYVNERGESVVFSPSYPYHVNLKDVSGLSDIRNEIYSINSMGEDGDTYLGNRIESRDIEIMGHIKERDKEQTQRHRRNLNHILNPQFNATLIYEFGTFKRVIGCKVNNAPMYVKRPVYEQFIIQLLCLNPFWREEQEIREDIAAWVGGFEFPIRDPDDKPDGLEIPIEGTWEIGYRRPSLIVNVYNGGDVRAGIRVDFRALGALISPSLLNVNTGEFIRLNKNMVAGDVLTVSTGYGEKAVIMRNRNGETSDAFRYLDVDSSYIQLAVGDNIFTYGAEENPESLEVTIYHNNYYLGV